MIANLKRKRAIEVFKDGLNNFSLIILMAIFIIPFIWMISTSLKSGVEITQFPLKLFPSTPQFKNFADAWKIGDFTSYIFNSIFVTLSILVLQIVIIVPAAYAFARKKFKGSKILFGMVLCGLMIPSQITFLPLYIFFSKAGLIDTYVPLIMPFMSSAFGIFFITQSFKQIPEDIIEAAKLDKASEWKIMYKIMLPMAKPAVITFMLFSFITHWNDYFWVLTMTNSKAYRTLPVAVASLSQVEGVRSWHVIMAGNVILVLPILIIYILANKKIKQAFTYMGLK